MTKEEAEEYAKKMTYQDAIYNLLKARCIPYRKATFIKVNELIKALEQEPILDRIKLEIEDQEKWLMQAGYNHYNVDIALDAIKSVIAKLEV